MSILARSCIYAARLVAKASCMGMATGPHITRFFMYRHLGQLAHCFSNSGRVLSISSSKRLCEVLGLAANEIVEADYPQYNLLNLGFPDNSFDFVIADQVLEHVEGNPSEAIKETCRVLKSGGIAVHTTCFLNPIHWGPKDYWRFTPDCLRYLGSQFGEVIDSGGWGNRSVLLYTILGLRHQPIPLAKWHPLNALATVNNPNWPTSTWLVLRK